MRGILSKKLFSIATAVLSCIIILMPLIINGCSSVPSKGTVAVSPSAAGKYHKIKKGQTLWQISRLYSVPLDELVKINHILPGEMIKEGQVLFIPILSSVPDKVSVPIVLPADTDLGSSDDFCWPLKGKVISTYGQYYRGMLNKGVNIQVQKSTPVVAARGGKVVFSSELYGFGKIVIIAHGDGMSSVYSRNSEVFVKNGDLIKKGTLIARVGAAGRDPTPYLHFEIRKGHLAQNPYFYLPD